ncbi:NUDIX hydrolase [Streptomyces europaeiscabiei]|uniref:NUDIX hydrolase n=1 Tax=Streptomyces europaeiscabiei TaxID=146819 RepID=UPI0029B59D7F|nr:NUDIX hydrolase [Streptomyces europaeiscabiei]MDX3588535.1 NUDIX hydrolase [Streptomyces europaeiscabiei]
MTTPQPDYSSLKPLAAVIEHAIQNTPIRLGTNDWGTALGSQLLADISVFMGKTLGPDAPILAEVQAERERQDARWGEQNHRDGTGNKSQEDRAEFARRWCESAFESGYGTWADILTEEVAEAEAERDPAKLRAELVQVAAVAVAWIAAIDRRTAAAPAV